MTHKIFDSFIHVDSSCWNGSQSSCRKNIIMVSLAMLTTTQTVLRAQWSHLVENLSFHPSCSTTLSSSFIWVPPSSCTKPYPYYFACHETYVWIHGQNTSCAGLSWSERCHSWLFVHALVRGSEKRTTHLLCSQCQSDLLASASGSLQRMGHKVRGQSLG